MPYFIFACFSIFLTSVGVSALQPTGVKPRGICTRDINPWGHPSRCQCDVRWQYNEKIGLCMPKHARLPEIKAFGQLMIDQSRRNQRVTKVELKVEHLGLFLLYLPKEMSLQALRNSQRCTYAIVGRLINVKTQRSQIRPAIIVKRISPQKTETCSSP